MTDHYAVNNDGGNQKECVEPLASRKWLNLENQKNNLKIKSAIYDQSTKICSKSNNKRKKILVKKNIKNAFEELQKNKCTQS